MKRRFIAGLMFVTAGILTVPAVGTAAAEGIDLDPGPKLCLLIYPPEPGCEFGGNGSSFGSIDLAALLGRLTNALGSVQS
ncbi:hypothetical protein EGT67_14395 [Prescottella agglutinans]|uniref:Uncharacterized protein n=2 Tax=Prescottella agglutinans TaxID=1644129 RepID=A0A438BCN7_9NOCA|nr:hypothetical protein EGT67_14395 [Prescottella agglutinans]